MKQAWTEAGKALGLEADIESGTDRGRQISRIRDRNRNRHGQRRTKH